MVRLKCDVKTCVFYENKNCIRETIFVSGLDAIKEDETNCNSYHKRERNKEKQNLFKSEISRIDDPNYYMEIGCEAINCKYNDHHKCQADKIKIAGRKASKIKDTFCSSFENK